MYFIHFFATFLKPRPGKELYSWLCALSAPLVSRAGCGIRLYRFLIIADSSTLLIFHFKFIALLPTIPLKYCLR